MHTPAPYPAARMRRLRRTRALREMVQENGLTAGDLIWPVFIRDGEGIEEPIPSLPGVNRLSLDRLLPAAERALTLGIPAICLFPYTAQELRTEDCAEAWNPEKPDQSRNPHAEGRIAGPDGHDRYRAGPV